MDEAKFVLEGYQNKPCEFRIRRPKEYRMVKGVISTFFIGEQRSYKLVTMGNIKKFEKLMDSGDEEGMRKLCEPIDLSDLESAKPLKENLEIEQQDSDRLKVNLSFGNLIKTIVEDPKDEGN